MLKIIVFFIIINSMLFAKENIQKKVEVVDKVIPYNPNLECLILADEDSVVCKFEVIRSDKEQQIVINWISPTGEISRTREMMLWPLLRGNPRRPIIICECFERTSFRC